MVTPSYNVGLGQQSQMIRLAMTEISVIIPARDAAATLPDTLHGLGAQTLTATEVIVVDDGSSDATAAIARESPVVTTVLTQAAAGPAHARNAGATAATAAKLAFLDADCTPAQTWLEHGARALDRADLVVGRTTPPPDTPVGPYDRTLYVTGPNALYESANLFATKALFESLHGFESWLGPAGGKELGEDVWFGWRARRSGARIAFESRALAHHAVFRRGSREYVAERMRLRFFPALVQRIPELRDELLHMRYFLNDRTGAFDLALGGVSLAVATRKRAPLALALPYALAATTDALDNRRHGATLPALRFAATRVTADAVGFAALLYGSARARTLLL
jgi:glycosyltransferase involved in cell wall biosynthesis